MKDADINRYKYTIPPRMQAYRKQKGVTQKKMAELLGVSTTYISNIEQGVNKLPLWVLDKYCEVLKIPVEDMLRTDDRELDTANTIAELVRKMPEERQSIMLEIAQSLSKAPK